MDRAHLCCAWHGWHTLNGPTGSPQIKKIITTMASQAPELLSLSTDWINRKFSKVCGHPKWFSPVKSQYTLSLCQHVLPNIRFEGVVELCSRLWLVVAVWQRDKRKGSIPIALEHSKLGRERVTGFSFNMGGHLFVVSLKEGNKAITCMHGCAHTNLFG